MRAVSRARARVFSGRGAGRAGERGADRRDPGGAVGVRALVLGGARSGKSSLAEELAAGLGGEGVLYVATAVVGGDPDLGRRVRLHRERRPAGWGTIEVGGGSLDAILEAAEAWRAVLFDSLTLWVSAQTFGGGEEGMLRELDRFLERSEALAAPVVVVSDEVGLGVVPESEEGRRFRDALGLANARVAAAAGEVHLCVAGIGVRIK